MKDAGIIVKHKGSHFTYIHFRHCKCFLYITPTSFWLHWDGNLKYGLLNWMEIFKYKGSILFRLCHLTIMQKWEIDQEASFKMPFTWKIEMSILTHNICLYGIFMQESWSRLPLFSPGDPPDPGSNPGLLCLLHWLESDLPVEWPGKPMQYIVLSLEENIRIYLGVNDNEQSIRKNCGTQLNLYRETMERGTDFIFLGPKGLWMVNAAMSLKAMWPLEEKLWQT